jgi:general secretion pathway protein D
MSWALQRFARRLCAAALALHSAVALAQQPEPAVRVYGIELERAAGLDRVVVQSAGAAAARLETISDEELALRIPNAVLDATAPRRRSGAASDAIQSVDASEAGNEVILRIRRRAGMPARLVERGGILAVEVERPEEDPERNVRISMRDAPLVQLVSEVRRITGRTFIYDDRLQGSVSVIVTDPITPGEALELLHATLFSKGFAAVPGAGDSLMILPLDEARPRARRERRALSAKRAALITTLVRFEFAPAEQLVNVLSPFAGGTTTVVAYPPTNGAILVGPEAALQRWLALARSLDETSRRELVVLRPRHRQAAELYALLADALLDPLTGRPRAELFLDERTNALIARAEPGPLAALRAQLAELDVAPETTGFASVIRLRFADADALAKLLSGIASGRTPSVSAAPRAASALAGADFSVVADKPSRSLVVTGDAAAQRLVRSVVDQIDVAPPTISVEAQVLEVVTTGQLALGVDAFLPTTDPANPGESVFGVGIGDPFDQVADPIDATFLARYAKTPFVVPIIGPGGVPVNVTLPRDIVQIKAAEGEARVTTLMRPHLLTISGEEHELTTGLNVPVPVGSTESAEGQEVAGDPLQTHVDIQRQDVGLRLRVKPIAGLAGDVRIAVDLELTDLLPSATGSRRDVGPTLASRKLQAHTAVEDGGVAVLGMLLERSETSIETGAPVLKDVPVLGHLLTQTLDRGGERRLLIALQAHIQRSPDERLADTIRLRMAHERSLARSGVLHGERAGWGLRVATRTARADAEALAAELGKVGKRRPRVVAWEWEGAERFDVVLAPYESAFDANEVLGRLRAQGLGAELVAMPSGEAGGG